MNLTEGPAAYRAAVTTNPSVSGRPNDAPVDTGPRSAGPRSTGTGPRAAGHGSTPDLPADHTQAILETTKEVGAVLKAAGLSFALVGSVAVYAHGIPVRLQHDTDFAVLRKDAEAVTRALRERGMRIVEPPEDWLVKGRAGGEEIDLIFALAGRPVTSELLARAQTLPVDSVHMPVLAPTDLMVSRLLALSEHHCDFGALLPVARGLRERIDWPRVREETGGAPMATAFLYLLELLDVLPRREAATTEETA
ncbi:nucleotidyltransferase family protein [Streptomyces sp. NPDC050842]|uniref:nucleotidyltransferase family protein n=1 Tax=Streptomyces sp. NPDC050842 TaxID=3365636 RepID=UPI00378CA8CA